MSIQERAMQLAMAGGSGPMAVGYGELYQLATEVNELSSVGMSQLPEPVLQAAALCCRVGPMEFHALFKFAQILRYQGAKFYGLELAPECLTIH